MVVKVTLCIGSCRVDVGADSGRGARFVNHLGNCRAGRTVKIAIPSIPP